MMGGDRAERERMTRQTTPKGDTLTSKQAAYVAARAVSSQKTAARLAGVSERTAQRWESSPVVRAAMRQQMGITLAESARAGATLTLSALRVAGAVLADTTQPTAARLAACRVVLSATPALLEAHDLAERVSGLEAAQPSPPTPSGPGGPGKL